MQDKINQLADLRSEINQVNQELVRLLAKRQRLTLQIGQIKKQLGRPILDRSREDQVLTQVRSLAKAYQLDPSFVQDLFYLIMDQAKKVQLKGRS